MKKFCGICEAYHDVTMTHENREYEILKTKVMATITILRCQNCGEEVYDRTNEISNDMLLFDTYKRVYGLLTSHDIMTIRKKYGLSQESFAKILGLGLKTITRYENGAIQDRTHDNLLRLVNDENNFVTLWVRYQDKLNHRVNEKIKSRLSLQPIQHPNFG